MMFQNAPGMASHAQRQMGLMGNPAMNPVSRPVMGPNPVSRPAMGRTSPQAYAQALRGGIDATVRPNTVRARPSFLNAKQVDYKNPGSVAGHYGWNDQNIGRAIDSRTSGGTKNAQQTQSLIDGYLGKRGTNLQSANPQQQINALDYAYRELSRKQQTKKPGLLGGILGTVLTAGLGAVNPALGIASGLAQSGGNPIKVGASFIPSPVKFRA